MIVEKGLAKLNQVPEKSSPKKKKSTWNAAKFQA